VNVNIAKIRGVYCEDISPVSGVLEKESGITAWLMHRTQPWRLQLEHIWVLYFSPDNISYV